MLLENVCSGTIHQVTAQELSDKNACEIKIIASTDDSGYGGIRRHRGWIPVRMFGKCFILAIVWDTGGISSTNLPKTGTAMLVNTGNIDIFSERAQVCVCGEDMLATCCGGISKPRTIALRRGCGRFLAEPQAAYDYMREELRKKQVNIPDLFWREDEELHLCSNADKITVSL